MKRMMPLLAIVTLLALMAAPAIAQEKPCNPCGGKAANPCGAKAAVLPAVNPCHAKLGTVFYIDDPMNRNQVTFTSNAPLENIVGLSNQIRGYVVFDPEHPEKGGRGQLVIDVASLGTGIPLRDEHLQSPVWLDAASYPSIEFTLEEVKDLKMTQRKGNARTYEGKAKGQLTLHGKTKKLEAPIRVTYLPQSDKTKARLPGDLLAGRAEFQVKLDDFDVQGMGDVVGSKVSETIEVEVNFVATNAAMQADNPCGGKAQTASNPCAK